MLLVPLVPLVPPPLLLFLLLLLLLLLLPFLLLALPLIPWLLLRLWAVWLSSLAALRPAAGTAVRPGPSNAAPAVLDHSTSTSARALSRKQTWLVFNKDRRHVKACQGDMIP